MPDREPFDLERYVRRSTEGACFICEFLNGNPDYRYTLVYETETLVVFLNKYPTLYGYLLVAPKKHLVDVTGSFSEDEYLEIQQLIYRASEAVRAELGPERIYILSLGSVEANAHVHWHIAPLPHGVPLENQQYHALMHENGVVEAAEDEENKYAMQIRRRLNEFADWFKDQSQGQQKIIRALRKLVAEVAPKLIESSKWTNGVWLKGDLPIIYIHTEPDHVQFGFFASAAFADPNELRRI